MIGKFKKKIQDLKGNEREALEDKNQAVNTGSDLPDVAAGTRDESGGADLERHTESRKILVVSPSDHCSDAVVDYAVGFADRMGYDIIVMNVLPLETHSPKLQPYCSVIHEEFKNACQKNITGFKKACEEKGIGFLHVVRSGDVNQCIRDVHQEYRRIEFVISDPVASPDVVKDGEKPVIPVFSLAY